MIQTDKDTKEQKPKEMVRYLSELIKARVSEGITREKLAQLVRVHRTTVYHWEKMEVEPENVKGIEAVLKFGGNLMELGKRLGDKDVQKAVIFDFLLNYPGLTAILAEIIASKPDAAKQIEVLLETYKKLNLE